MGADTELWITKDVSQDSMSRTSVLHEIREGHGVARTR